MQKLYGIGEPIGGDDFQQGNRHLEDAEVRLSLAHPQGSWLGSASRAYTAQNNVQQARAANMKRFDAMIGLILQREAEQVNELRGEIDGIRGGLIVAIPEAVKLYNGPGGPQASYAWQIALATTELGKAEGLMEAMAAKAAANGDSINVWTRRYVEVAGAAENTLSGTSPDWILEPQSVRFTPQRLTELAGSQDTASLELNMAKMATDGVVDKVWKTHGNICEACTGALAAAVAARNNAIYRTIAVCQKLSRKLYIAHARYLGVADPAATDLAGLAQMIATYGPF